MVIYDDILFSDMKAFIAILSALCAIAITDAFDIVSSTTAGLSVPLLAVGGAGTNYRKNN